MRGWVIDRDYINRAEEDREFNRVGYGQTLTENREGPTPYLNRVTVRNDLRVGDVEDPVRFKLLDDDGEVYFGGAVTQGWLTGDDTDEEGDDLAYGIDRFGEADAGAVLSLFRAQDLEGTRLLERYRELDLVRDDGWVQVYG